MEEITYYYHQFKIDAFFIPDNVFTINKKRVLEFYLKRIIKAINMDNEITDIYGTEDDIFDAEKPAKKIAPKFNPMELLNNPLVSELMNSGKELFKKKEADPNMCEINIKAPSEVVLKLFKA